MESKFTELKSFFFPEHSSMGGYHTSDSWQIDGSSLSACYNSYAILGATCLKRENA